ncbi:Ig-like domain-containing protein [Entomomonas asaccharolytica]|uniref:Uncharacterized protein n=1 Tax=Entomomonas asaccharolytica TaxID=2785331 RepID=A0A974NDK7_9GAMM|nr:Ig-like domain-containing protein [Entomomonas asaccharolytica]QQP84810.1 hypothetical protein JHT90_10400 [Entomomonas asaccharolytica]
MSLLFFSQTILANNNVSSVSNDGHAGPTVEGVYTNKAPKWIWHNTYQVDIQNLAGESVYNEVVGDIDQLTFIDGFIHGNSYKARIRSSIDNGATWGAWSDFSLLTTVDTVKPTITVDEFVRPRADVVRVNFTAEDDLSGVANGHLQIAEDALFESVIFDEVISVVNSSFETEGLPTDRLLYARIKVADNAGNVSDYSDPKAVAITVPVIVQPVNNTVIRQALLAVTGTAEAGGKVKLYLNDGLVDQEILVDNEGKFSATITLQAEGNYKLAATVENDYEVSSLSSEISFSYQLPAPKAVFVKPAEGIELSTSTDIEVSAIDELGISKVEFFVDDVLFATVTEAPYSVHWDITSVQNGEHVLTAVVSNTSNKTVTITRLVTVKVEPPAPPPTIYTGKLLAITPEVTYGLQPITITGQAVYRADQSLVADVPLKLVLMIDGFERKINVVTDAEGVFSYKFIPQESDAGVYQVAIIHPNETVAISQGGFTINRIKFNLVGYNLKAIRHVTTEIKVNATASAATTGLRWIARAEDQETGSLPVGIDIESGSGINISAGKTATTIIKFTADETALSQGVIHLVALANESNDLVRGRLQLNYQIGEATPSIYASPTYIQTGLQQQESITENIIIGNRGLAVANDVQVTLLDAAGSLPPSWIFIATDNDIGNLAVGETVPIQIIAHPDSSVPDGIYHFNIHVSATNSNGGVVPVAISVTQSGQGIVRFDVADIYTATLDENGNPILGVKGATIKLQNEAVLTEEYNITTDEQGVATLTELPPGIYRYRASAANHMDTSGRVVVRPNVTVNEHIFLEYQTVNIEFGVTETTIEDIYDIDVNATFNTQVPAPVVLLEPLAINLAGMLPGEERTGEITLTNYGLVQADNVVFKTPHSDSQFIYEFFGEVPNVLPPKTRIVIPYKVIAVDESLSTHNNAQFSNLLKATAQFATSCSNYSANYSEAHQSECANGDISSGGSNGKFYVLRGSNCSGSSIGGWGGSAGSGGGGFGGGSITSPPAIPLTSGCMPDCTDDCCGTGGAGGANE